MSVVETHSAARLSAEQALDLFRYCLTAREIDAREAELVAQGRAFFHVSGAGHEASAALARHLTADDWLHLHYRDKALLLARGLETAEFFRSLLAKGTSHSAGRQMSAHLSAPHLNVLSMVGPVGNNALQAVGVAAAVKERPGQPIVVCSLGDGTAQQGEVLEAIAEAVRWQLPVLFLIEDNRFAISTTTAGKTWFNRGQERAEEFYGLSLHHLDGSNVLGVDAALRDIVGQVRETRGPQIAILHVERLHNHTNADDQSQYRAADDIASGAQRDPLLILRSALEEEEVAPALLDDIARFVHVEVQTALEQVLVEPEPVAEHEAAAPWPAEFTARAEFRGDEVERRIVMREALAGVLRQHLADDPRVMLYGQDIEDPKGDVFGVTRGLSSSFPGRVVNAPLTESTIVGTCIGRALAGQRPVAFLQFADFLPLAANQILSELGSMHWRTSGGWQCPVVLMVACGGYKPGLGPFHAQTLESLLAHTPGIDVVMPSTAADAAGLLNAALASPRPTVILYPKACLNSTADATSGNLADHWVTPGKARRVRAGGDITLVAWGSTMPLVNSAADVLEEAGYAADVWDLRSIAPWDRSSIIASVGRTGRLVVVHEDNATCGFGAEVIATVAEQAKRTVHCRRVARSDTYVPFHFGNQREVLPSAKSVLAACAELLECELVCHRAAEESAGILAVRAIGSGPADESVTVASLHVKVGDTIQAGQVVAEVEATKSVVDVCSQASGEVIEVCARCGDQVAVDAPLVRLRTARSAQPQSGSASETFELRRRTVSLPLPSIARTRPQVEVGIAGIVAKTGSRVVTNEELIERWPDRTVQDIERLTGIRSRRWAAAGETPLSLAVDAASQLLTQQRLSIHNLDLVIAATTTPEVITPALACRVAAALAGDAPVQLPAYDVSAACSGYLYALAQAWDFLQQQPDAKVLIVTSEVLSPQLDPGDFETAILFGDAASATLLTGHANADTWLKVHRPTIAGQPEREASIRVPLRGEGMVGIDGKAVFRQAVRAMERALHEACRLAHLNLSEVDLVVPHQANQRIIEALTARTSSHTLSAMAEVGNCSSSSIPLALAQRWAAGKVPQRIACVTVGGGLTSAAFVAERQTHAALRASA